MIRILKLNKYYNKGRKNQIHVINNSSLELPDSGMVALLGPSGCGKTTLLNAIGGLDKVNKGHIYINNQRITKKSSAKIDKIRNLKIGYIFQDYKLIDNMSVYDNVAIALKMIGIKDKKEIKTRVDYILEKVGMYRYRNRPCKMLSGGERQRVGIARAIVKNPDIILADEPTGNLDSKNTIEIMNIIKSISSSKLVILVTHEEELAKFYATRIIEIKDGTIINDYENNNNNSLDYRMDNKFYLKDFKYYQENHDNDINIKLYSDIKTKLDLIVIFKNGNIYIENKGNDKIEVIDSNSNIEIINDNYKEINADEYLKYKFEIDKISNENIKLKYSSIFNIFTIFSEGFKKIFSYSFIKKVLLCGFFLSSIFSTYAISNVLGLISIDDKEFIKTNKNYLLLESNKINYDDYLNYSKINYVNYILPGDSQVSMTLDSKMFYQTSRSNIIINGSLASYEMINKDNLVIGRMPENNHEIVIDKMIYDNNSDINMIGIYSLDKILNKKVYIVEDILEYEIVGVVSLNSPSIYVYPEEFINIISNSQNQKEDIYYDNLNYSLKENSIYDYELYKSMINITKGRIPSNDYEVIINEELKDIYKIDKELDFKVNNKKLKVVGYYKSSYNISSYFVSKNTININTIINKSNLVIYSLNKEDCILEFNNIGKKVTDVYKYDKEKYLNSIHDSIVISLILAGIMLGISLIEIVLMMRSSFLSRIKDVGIYRAIGVKKSDIYKMFIGESFAISTLASLPGILFMSYILNTLSSISYISKNYLINGYTIIFTIIVIYLFNIIVGLIPVGNTIRKSPASILSRNDLD